MANHSKAVKRILLKNINVNLLVMLEEESGYILDNMSYITNHKTTQLGLKGFLVKNIPNKRGINPALIVNLYY